MPRGNRNNDKDRNNDRGRGRGQRAPSVVPTPATASASRAPRHPYPHTTAEIDVVVQQWPESSTIPGASANANGGGNVNRWNEPWRGGMPRWRSGAGTPSRGMGSPRRGNSTQRGNEAGRGQVRGRGRGRDRGRGRGYGPDNGGDSFSVWPRRPHLGVGVSVGTRAGATIGKDAPLSHLLYSERPLLRPVKFVPATLTPILFQDSEEVLKPTSQAAADTTVTSHVPTADSVARVFHEHAPVSDSESEDQAQDALEEIDFADLAQVRAEVDAIAQGTATMSQGPHEDQEDIEEVDFVDLAAIRAKVDAAELQADSRDDIIQEAFTGVYLQVKETTQVSTSVDAADDPPRGMQALSALDLKPSIDHSNVSGNHEVFTHARDTVVVEEELSKVPETGVTLHPDTPSHDDPHPLFVVDTTPTCPFTGHSTSDVILVDRTGRGETLGDQDEERIVYVAPHPRSGHASPIPTVPRVKLPHTRLLTGRSVDVGRLRSPIREDDASPVLDQDRTRAGLEVGAGADHQLSLASLSLEPTASTSTSPPAQVPRTNAVPKVRKKEGRFQRQKKQGAIVSEARLREEDVKDRRHPRWETRRRGDSDVDWGTESEDEDGEDEDGVDAVSSGLGGMEIDQDLVMDVDAMRGFLKSMSAEGSRFVTMDDINDAAQMQLEDEEGQGGPEGSSDSERSDDDEVEVDSQDEREEEEEEEEVFNIEEEILIAESEGDDELPNDSDSDEHDDDELSPRSSFQARLRKVRERSRSQQPKAVQEVSDDDSDDEEFLAHINDLIEENSQILSGRDRKQKMAVFRNLHRGYVDAEAFIDDPRFTTPANKKKKEKKGKDKQTAGCYFAAELEAQWTKDRAKKAERKRQRKTARLFAALDPFSADVDGRTRARTSRKAMEAAARLDPSAALSVAPRAVVDIASLEAQVRRFVEDVGERKNMAFPPMEKEMRKRVHEMADAFGLKSVSKGKGNRRYTTLIKTTKTRVNEGRMKATMKRYGGGKGRGVPRHREGDEVGKEAPKIGENNIGFRMLASMGWSEGDRIGGTESGGIEVPLAAIIKHSRLGLGATR